MKLNLIFFLFLFAFLTAEQTLLAESVDTIFCDELERVILRVRVVNPGIGAHIYIKPKPSVGNLKYIVRIPATWEPRFSYDYQMRAAQLFREIKECKKLKIHYASRTGDEAAVTEIEITAIGR
ncbi:MAG: hypothetical protein HYY62_09480 [Deltaproteobacteria bacterium]|nr:hypothetical protein [Deltaproteobacteria bacterium]